MKSKEPAWAFISAAFFDTTTYIGAFRPGDPASNWLSTPWISFRLH